MQNLNPWIKPLVGGAVLTCCFIGEEVVNRWWEITEPRNSFCWRCLIIFSSGNFIVSVTISIGKWRSWWNSRNNQFHPQVSMLSLGLSRLAWTPQHRFSSINTGEMMLLADGYAALFEEIYSYAVVNLVNLLRPPIQWIHCSTIIFLWKTTSQDWKNWWIYYLYAAFGKWFYW